MRFWHATLVAVTLLAPAAGAGAQESAPARPPVPPPFQIPSGTKVRLSSTALPGGVVEGRVGSSTDEALGLVLPGPADAPFGTPVLVPRASVTRLQVSVGYRRYTLHGAALGALAGAAAGAAWEVDPATCDSYSSETFCSRGEAVAIGALSFAAIGALVGHLVKTERWQNVSVEALAPPRSSDTSRPRGRWAAAGLAVTVRF